MVVSATLLKAIVTYVLMDKQVDLVMLGLSGNRVRSSCKCENEYCQRSSLGVNPMDWQ
ncbi:uncharacterized protein PHALS_09626 [Plasmopara halstedii]|uniref:Uncharacterized protein n=1 Tax=Plasmopara halstedii TaxID=4781 RepID=A0A0P1AE98_PLAHL|nr:uncharacterized protein PHALS_09626 [Plasmopara halstedii]CEG39375.1 hypothetical protein PHALS_09626 [Plasmopara halstedii]|eukprot:XP_024575744.1 hypothetical protein PHALS_09626 [Plasmopara halstedii]